MIALLISFLLAPASLDAQVGNLIKRVSKSVANDILGLPEEKEPQPEPECACDQADLVFDLGGKLKLEYSELTLSMLKDGSLLVRDNQEDRYYIVKDGVTKGPYKPDDPRVREFEEDDGNEDGIDGLIARNQPYISRSGEKLVITFKGVTYGPYSMINDFIVSKSGNKFAAVVIENMIVSVSEAERFEEAMKNASTDQEKMAIAMEYSKLAQQNMARDGGQLSNTPTLVTNIPGSTLDVYALMAGGLNGKMKYDDIVYIVPENSEVKDLKGNTLLKLDRNITGGSREVFINSGNNRYAAYNYGVLEFSDGSTLEDLFNPYMKGIGGKVYLAYMYYSPKRNSIMECKIEF